MTKPAQRNKENARAKLAVAIRERMRFDEDWTDFLPQIGTPSFFREIQDFDAFSDHFKQAVEQGCRWDVLLFCLELFFGYNTESRNVLTRNELGGVEIKETITFDKAEPPSYEQRVTNKANLDAAIRVVKENEDILLDRIVLMPPPVPGWAKQDELVALAAVEHLQRLLKWARDVLIEPRYNFRRARSARTSFHGSRLQA